MTPQNARVLVKIGLGLQFVRLVFVAVTTFKMMRVFEQITVFGTGDPHALSRGISEALHYGGTGLGSGIIGLVLVWWGILGARLRDRWVWWGGILAGVSWLPFFPTGTVIGGGTILAVLWNASRREAVR